MVDRGAAVRRALEGPERLVTLTGPGGIGKTWLARQAAGELGRAFADGTYVVGLGDLPDAGMLVPAVAEGLGLRLSARDAGVSALVVALADRQLLLVLDRCEHLLPECARLAAELLKGCPGLRVLTTSREPLRVTGERVVRVPPMSVPADPSGVDPSTAMTYDGVAHFVERATAVLPAFRLTEENLQAVVLLCRRLDGNPLALQLAAARAGLLAPEAILERLDDRYRLLAKGAPDAPPHQRSLRASVDASWELCTDRERALWQRLSVFPADLDLEAAEEVCSGEGIDRTEILDLVDSLLGKSVLVREAAPDAVRYRLPETLRGYGAERLGEDARRHWSERHLLWCERLARTAAAQWFGPGQTGRIHRLGREYANLRAALDSASADPAGAPRALRIVQALEPWWPVAGRLTEARRWLAAALRHGSGSAEERARALVLAARLATSQADLAEAEELLGAATRTGEATAPGTRAALARAAGGLALAHGHHDEAAAHFEDSVDLASRARCGAAVAEGWLLVGLARLLAGRAADAEQALLHCVALTDRAGETQLRACALALRALVALGRDELSSALALARAALRTKAEVDDRSATAFMLEVVAWVALAEGDHVRAAVLLGAADGMWQRLGVGPAAAGPPVVGREERLAQARAALGRREFDRQWARGAALTRDAVLRYAQDDVLPRQRSPATSGPLTARELAVAELVARGMSNREIAAALVISVRTVQGHVENILRKLGFGSRAQVAAWVAQRSADSTP